MFVLESNGDEDFRERRDSSKLVLRANMKRNAVSSSFPRTGALLSTERTV